MNDQATISLECGKTGALLAYLATEAGRPHPRQALAGLLWPERSVAEGLSSLRFALSKLRTMLHDRQSRQPLLLVSRSQVQLNPQADVWVDAVAFQDQATACEVEASKGASLPLDRLQAALALYQGSFLQGFNLGDCLDFETWALGKRDHLDRQRLRLLELLALRLEAEGQYPQAEETYRRILVEQPWDENTHRRLMCLLAAGGQRSSALAEYETCRQELRELGVEPSSKTNLLYHRIKRTSSTAGLLEGQVAPADELPATPFVAREYEMKRLEAFLECTLARQGQVVLITGEAGSGKTALMSMFARQALARHPDLLVVGGQCDAYTGTSQSYQPFIECGWMLVGEWETLSWAELLPAEDRARLQEAVPQAVQALVETAPALLDRFYDRDKLRRAVQASAPGRRPKPTWLRALGKTPASTAARLETGLLFEQITRLFTALSRQHPLILLLDDLHWSDPGSAALLFHLARRLATCRILILAAYRPGELSGGREGGEHPFSSCVTEIQRYGGNVRLDLDRSDELAFVSALLEQDPKLQPHCLDEAFRTNLARRTGGNPLFTIELLHSLQARGDLFLSAAGVWESRPELDWSHLPARVEAAIAGRMSRLPSKWLDWLSTASVEGECFTAEVLAQVHADKDHAGVEEEALLQDLNGSLGMGRGAQHLVQGEGVQWIEVEGSCQRPLSRYRFHHILFQTYLYQQLNPVERSRRHAAVGLALEALCGKDVIHHAAELARHFEAGGLLEKAAAYHLEAGRQATFLASDQVAVVHYRRGLDLLAGLPHTPQRDRLEIGLYLALGAPFLLAEGWGGPERQQVIQKALELIEKTGKEATWPDLFPALFARADWLISQGELSQAIRIGEQMLALAGEQASLPLALAHRILGLSHSFQGNFNQARRHLEDALSAYKAIGQPPTILVIGGDLDSACRAILGFVLALSGYPDQARAQTLQALSRARKLKHISSLGSTLIFACEMAILHRDLPALQDMAGELLQLGQAEERRFFKAYGLAADGYVQLLQCEPGKPQAAASLEQIRSAMQLWESTGTRSGRGQWIVRLAEACLLAGQTAAGLEVTTNALNEPETPGIAAGLARIYRLQGELLLRQSPPERDAAQASFTSSLEIARQQGAHTLELRAALSLAKLWQAERPDEARRLLEETCAWFSEGWETIYWQEAQALLKHIS